MARELYGPELVKKRVLELNASNERGIDVIRQSRHFGTATLSLSLSLPLTSRLRSNRAH